VFVGAGKLKVQRPPFTQACKGVPSVPNYVWLITIATLLVGNLVSFGKVIFHDDDQHAKF
jgi:hypothetical protein